MKNNLPRNFLYAAITGLLVVASPVSAQVSVAGMKACKMAVLGKSRFHDLPMASISVYPGKKANRAHFTVRWDGLRAEGNCVVDGAYVQSVNVKQFHDGRRGNSDGGKWENSGGLDGFYYDRHVSKWRDPKGRVCHTCTPENGFPDHSSRAYNDWHPKNKLERKMERHLRNTLSDEDIRALNSLTR